MQSTGVGAGSYIVNIGSEQRFTKITSLSGNPILGSSTRTVNESSF